MMYTAMVEYKVQENFLPEFVQIWKKKVFLGMQLYTRAAGTALAVGHWESQEELKPLCRQGFYRIYYKR